MSLTQRQLDQFKSELELMKADVYKRYQKREEQVDSEEMNSNENHMGDSATEEFEHGKELTLQENDKELLDEIEEALQRIEDGSYGICIDSGEEISSERLKAIPYAKRTIEAQKKYDQQRKPPNEQSNDRREDPASTIEQIEEEQSATGR